MPTQCVKIKLKAGTLEQAREWANELTRRADEVRAVMKTEGVSLEAAFLDEQAGNAYLIYIMHAENFEKAKRTAEQSTATIDAYHKNFKKNCWESRTVLEPLIDFFLETDN